MTEKDVTITGKGPIRSIRAGDKLIAEAVMSDGGFFMLKVAPAFFLGLCPAWLLRAIADRLDEINKPWKEFIDETLGQPNTPSFKTWCTSKGYPYDGGDADSPNAQHA